MCEQQTKKTTAEITEKTIIPGSGIFCWAACGECGMSHMVSFHGWTAMVCRVCKAEMYREDGEE